MEPKQAPIFLRERISQSFLFCACSSYPLFFCKFRTNLLSLFDVIWKIIQSYWLFGGSWYNYSRLRNQQRERCRFSQKTKNERSVFRHAENGKRAWYPRGAAGLSSKCFEYFFRYYRYGIQYFWYRSHFFQHRHAGWAFAGTDHLLDVHGIFIRRYPVHWI